MESKELRSLINQYLFVSISEELAEQLKDVACAHALEISSETVTKYAKAVFNNQVEWKFKNSIYAKYKEQYVEELSIPSVVYLILEGYTLRQILKSDTLEDSIKAMFSLIVRNCAVTRKGNWNGIICSKWLIEVYNYYEQYSKKKVISSVPYSSLLMTIVPKSQWLDTGLEISEKNVYDQIRSLCASGVRVSFNRYVGSSEFKNINSPFVQAYMLVKRMVLDWNWKYITDSPVDKLRVAMGDGAKKRKQLHKIVSDVIAGVPKEQQIKAKEGSSILLARIEEGKSAALDERMFSALEFGVYLYYELLLETFND